MPFLEQKIGQTDIPLANTNTLENQKRVVSCIMYTHQISQDYPGYRFFFRDFNASSNINFQKSWKFLVQQHM